MRLDTEAKLVAVETAINLLAGDLHEAGNIRE